MRYGPGLLEEILQRTDIVQLVGRRVKLERKGRVFWGLCPFHKEKSASFKVENERRSYKCFGCGAGGDAFRWLMETEGLSFPEAVERLASEAGVQLPKWTPEDEAREAKRKSLYDIVELAAQFFEEQLRAPAGAEARAYLESRGLGEEDWKRFRIGFAPDARSALHDRLKAKGVAAEDMIAAGLVRAGEEARGRRDFFFGRVTFAIADGRGRAVGFGARALAADAKPKYINSSDSPLFDKGRLLYNLHAARAAAMKSGNLVVAEGYMDVIALVRAGFEASVAPLGTALTEDQLMLLWRFAPEPVLAFDGDEAGARAAGRAARLALPRLQPGQSLRFAFLPAGEDPDSFLRRHGTKAMAGIIEAAQPLAEVLWRGETEGRDFATPERRAGLERALGEIVRAIREPTVADYYRREFENRVFETFKRRAAGPRTGFKGGYRAQQGAGRDRGAAGHTPRSKTVSDAVRNSLMARAHGSAARAVKEAEVASFLLVRPDLAALHGEILAAIPLSDRELDRLRGELLNLAASGARLDAETALNHLVRQGLAGLCERLQARRVTRAAAGSGPGGEADAEDIEARWLGAVAQLREMAELEPERRRAIERFKSEASDEAWDEARTLLGPGRGAG